MLRLQLDSLSPQDRQALMYAMEQGFHLSFPTKDGSVVGVNYDNSPIIKVVEQHGVFYLGRLANAGKDKEAGSQVSSGGDK